jgi:hypothetical protein
LGIKPHWWYCVKVLTLLDFPVQEGCRKMKPLARWLAVAIVALLYTFPASGQNPNNPIDDALLRWYTANLSVLFTGNGLSPNYPIRIAFDGKNMWITDSQANSVTKLRASDGACVGTCMFSVGNSPTGLAFDGANIWVANALDNTVTKLQAASGTVLGTYATGPGPWDVAFDGSKIWISNNGISSNNNTVTVLNAVDGSLFGTFTAGPAGTSVTGLAFDGSYMWVGNSTFTEESITYTVTRLLASNGACGSPCTFNVGRGPFGLAYDGTHIWVSNTYDGTVTELLASTGGIVATINVGGCDPCGGGVAFDGANVWVALQLPSQVAKIQASSGLVMGTFQLGPNTNTPEGVAFDGANIWVVYGPYGRGGVYKL